MKRYFSHQAESELGEGVAYLEFDGQYATRQLEVYQEGVRIGTMSDSPDLVADQPLDELGLTEEYEISFEKFEAAWRKYSQ